MKRATLAASFTAVIGTTFYFLNRGAYRGYFDAADINRLADPARTLDKFLYVALGRSLDFARYITAIQALHFLTAAAVFLLLRRLKFESAAALAGSAFFALNLSAVEIVWQPSRSPELAAALLSTMALLAWTYDRWLISLLCLFLAAKCSGAALFLPLALAAYERTLGSRRWRRLLPFFAVTVVMGLPLAVRHDDIIRITPTGLWASLKFVFARLVWIPALAAVLLVRDARAQFGLAAFAALIAPALAVPFDLSGARLHLPAVALSILVASMLRRPAVLAIFVAVWIPLSVLRVSAWRVQLIAAQTQPKRYAEAVSKAMRSHGVPRTFVCDKIPDSLGLPGVRSLLELLAPGARVLPIEDPGANQAMHQPSVAILRWHPEHASAGVAIRTPSTPDLPYIVMNAATPEWQLGEGWYGYEGVQRWVAPRSVARLMRPADARTLELHLLVTGVLVKRDRPLRIQVSAGGSRVGEQTVTREGEMTLSWPLAPAGPGTVEVEIRVDPPYYPNPDGAHPLGVVVRGFGFK